MERTWVPFSYLAFNLTILILAIFTILIAMPSKADSSEFADVDFHLSRECIGENCKFALDNPTDSRPKYWVAQNDPPVQNEYYSLSTWEINMGGPLNPFQ